MKKPWIALLLALAVGAALVVWSLSGSEQPRQVANARPGAATAAPPAAPAEPTPPSSADTPAPESARESVRESDVETSREARLLAEAQWVDVDVALASGTPLDERVELFAIGFARDRFPTDDQAAAGQSAYKQRWSAGGWFGLDSEPEGPDPDELACERAPDGHFRAPFPKGSTSGLLRLKSRYVYADELTRVELPAERVAIATKLGGWLSARLVLPRSLPADVDPAAIEPFTVTVNGWKMGADNENHGARTEAGPGLSFEFGGLRPSLSYFLNASPPQFADFADTGISLEPAQHLERTYELKLGARISGRVLDASGAPFAQAKVRADSAKQRMFDFNGGRWTTSADDGSFELRGVDPGKTTVHAGAKGTVDAKSDALELVDGQVVRELELRLGAGKTLAGRVTWPDGSAAAAVTITAVERDPDDKRGGALKDSDTKSDTEGKFSIAGLTADRVDVTATIDVERDINSVRWRVRRKDVPVETELALILETPNEVRGRVVDDLGAPITAFTLKSTEILEQEDWRNPSITTPFKDDGGAFSLSLGSGTWDVSAAAEGHTQSDALRVALPGAGDELVFTLQRSASLSGRVTDPSGAPIAGAKVGARASEKRRGFDRGNTQGTSDAEGRFEVQGVKAGAVTLTATHESYAPSEALTVEAGVGEPVADLVLTLRVGGRLEGEIYAANGTPDPGRQIMVGKFGFNEADFGGSATSDGSGTFAVEHLAPGNYNVIATPKMDQFAQQEGEMDEAELMASLKMTSVEIRDGETSHVVLGAPPKAPVRLTGRVTQGGEPLRTGMVMAVAEGKSMLDSMKMGKLDSDGRYALTLDGAGDYSFVIAEQMGDDHSVEFSENVPEVEAFELDFVVPGGEIRGRVVSRDGTPLDSIPVSIESEGRGSILIVDLGNEIRTDEEGRFEFKRLKPGSYTVRAGAGRFDMYRSSSLRHAVAVRSGLVVSEDRVLDDVELRLESPGKIAGIVRDADGKAVDRATVFVRDAQGRMLNPVSSCTSDGLGKFEFDGAGPGTYTVSARSGKLASRDSLAVRVVADETTEVELRLEAGTVLRVSVADDDDKLIRANLRVVDDAGREVSGLFGADALEHLLTEGFSTTEQRVGPLAPGKYKVTATSSDGVSVTKPVTLTGNEERFLRIKLKE